MLNESERELLLICARQTLPAELARRAKEILDGPLRWEELVAAAWRHGVAPLLFHHVQAMGGKAVTVTVLHSLRQTYVRVAFRNQVHFAAIGIIAKLFAAARVPLVLLKGAALASTIYRDPVLRPFADIDLLVAAADVDAAKQILIGAGYELAPELLSEKLNRKYHNNLPLLRRVPHPVHVELHWRLSDSFSLIAFDHETLLARRRGVTLGDSEGYVLGWEDQLVYLAAHLDNHGYLNRVIVDRNASGHISLHELSGDRIIWFTDLHELIVHGLDWTKVLDSARRACAAGALAVSLRLLRALLRTPIPETVFAQLPLPEMGWPERSVGDYVITLATKPLSDISVVRFQKRFLSTRQGFELRLIRLLDLWQYVFPRRALVAESYLVHVCAAVAQCTRMLFELLWWRAFRFVRAKGRA